jgi:hypothetical protein
VRLKAQAILRFAFGLAQVFSQKVHCGSRYELEMRCTVTLHTSSRRKPPSLAPNSGQTTAGCTSERGVSCTVNAIPCASKGRAGLMYEYGPGWCCTAPVAAGAMGTGVPPYS